MVTDSVYKDSPHIIGVDLYDGVGLVGIEKTSGENGWYISKTYHKRDGLGRGESLIVSVSAEDLKKCCILDSPANLTPHHSKHLTNL